MWASENEYGIFDRPQMATTVIMSLFATLIVEQLFLKCCCTSLKYCNLSNKYLHKQHCLKFKRLCPRLLQHILRFTSLNLSCLIHLQSLREWQMICVEESRVILKKNHTSFSRISFPHSFFNSQRSFYHSL